MATLKGTLKVNNSNNDILYPKTSADLVDGLSLTTTTGSESITVDNSSLTLVTRDTAQTISGAKTFSTSPILNNNVALKSYNTSNASKQLIRLNSSNNLVINGDNSGGTFIGGNSLSPVTTSDLGTSSYKWINLYMTGTIRNDNSSYGLSLPTMSTWTANKTIATTDQIPTVNNATLTIQNNGTTVNTFTANASSNVTANITTPTIKRYI